MNKAGKVVETKKEREAVEMELGEAFAVFKSAFRDGKEYDDSSLLTATYIVSHAETFVESGQLEKAIKAGQPALTEEEGNR